jgi:hypothetical protein
MFEGLKSSTQTKIVTQVYILARTCPSDEAANVYLPPKQPVPRTYVRGFEESNQPSPTRDSVAYNYTMVRTYHLYHVQKEEEEAVALDRARFAGCHASHTHAESSTASHISNLYLSSCLAPALTVLGVGARTRWASPPWTRSYRRAP